MDNSKDCFYQGMYQPSDTSDEDLDNFQSSKETLSQSATHSQDLESRKTLGVEPVSSQTSSQATQKAPIKIDLNNVPHFLKDNYILGPDDYNRWLKLTKKKDLIIAASTRLAGYVLFYWPASSSTMPGKFRRHAYAAVIKHGGGLAKQWDDGQAITHIIVESVGKGREYKDVLADLKLEKLPNGVFLVKSDWVDRKIRPIHRLDQATSEARFRISGDPEVERPTSKRAASDTAELQGGSKRTRTRCAEAPVLLRSATEGISSKVLDESEVRVKDNATNAAIESESPKLMKQCNLANTGARLALESIRSRLALALPEQHSRVVASHIQREDDRYNAVLRMQQDSGHGSEITMGGRNIDRLDKILAGEQIDGEAAGSSEAEAEAEDEDEVLTGMGKHYQCGKKNIKDSNKPCPNDDLIKQLDSLATRYASKRGDEFRAKGYRQAISVLRRQKHKIVTKEQAMALPHIGESIATKIAEFAAQGKVKLVEVFANDPRERVLKLFAGIYGAGARTTEEWYNQGYRTLEDLRKLDLHEHQRIGLERYEDFNTRIPRDEVTQHVEYVTRVARKISEHLEIVVGGSYRRGQADSGDIDFLVTAPDSVISTTQLQRLVFDQLIPELREAGYIKANLASPAEKKDPSKWLGAGCLPGAGVWRRIDILMVPNHEWGAALIYFTGNDIFNRSMRLLARRNGGTLNQRGLYKGVVRDREGVKISSGELVEGRDEKKIFEALEVKWRPPHERCP